MRNRERALGIVGIVGAVIYALACRPAWSPDGRQIAFPFVDEKADTVGIALYDLNTKQARRVFEDKSEDDWPMQVVWPPSGESLVALRIGEKKLRVMHMSLKDGRHQAGKTLPGSEACLQVPPVVSPNGRLWISWEQEDAEDGDKAPGLLRIDALTGDTQFVRTRVGAYLAQNGNTYAYLGMNEDEDTIEVGRFDPATAELRKLSSFAEDQFPGELTTASLAVRKDGSGLALGAKKGERLQLVILDGEGEIVHLVPLPQQVKELDQIAWGQDADTIWASAELRLKKDEGDDDKFVGLVEVDIVTEKSRMYPVKKADSGGKDGNFTLLRPSLSPDEKTLAIAVFTEGPQDNGLWLFDLTTPDRGITRVPLPPSTVPAQEEAKGKEGQGKAK